MNFLPFKVGYFPEGGKWISYPAFGGDIPNQFWNCYFEVIPELFHKVQRKELNSQANNWNGSPIQLDYKYPVMSELMKTQLDLVPNQPSTQSINDRNKRLFNRVVQRLALVITTNSVHISPNMPKTLFHKSDDDSDPKKHLFGGLASVYNHNLQLLHYILFMMSGLHKTITLDKYFRADVDTVWNREIICYMKKGVYGNFIPSNMKDKKTKDDEGNRVVKTHKEGFMLINEFFLLYPLYAGNLAQRQPSKDVPPIPPVGIDSWIQGSVLQRKLRKEEFESNLAHIGGSVNLNTSAIDKLRELAKQTGMEFERYPIHMKGNKVLVVMGDSVCGSSYENDRGIKSKKKKVTQREDRTKDDGRKVATRAYESLRNMNEKNVKHNSKRKRCLLLDSSSEEEEEKNNDDGDKKPKAK